MLVLQINNLVKKYYLKKGVTVEALNGVSLDFDNTGLVFILGKSGSGKSTLLNVIGGLDRATSGEVVLNEKSCSDFTEEEFEVYRNSHIGFIFQDYNLINKYNVGENIALALEIQGKAAVKSEIDSLLKRLDLVDENCETLYNRKINELSGGQKQRVAIARALIKNSSIILADEPTGALDSTTGKQFYELLRELSKDKLIIVVSHDKDSAETYGDRIIEMQDGKIVSDTTKGETKIISEYSNKDVKKCSLPFKHSFKMGINSLLYKKFRLVLSILLSTFTIVVFGFCLIASSLNTIEIELNTMFASGQRTVLLQSQNSDRHFTQRQKDLIFSYCEFPMKVGMGYVNVLDYIDIDYGNISNPYINLAMQPLMIFAETDTKFDTINTILQPDERFKNKALCRLPKNKEEIAITDLRADVFMRFGFKDNDGSVLEINSPDDLIGKKIGVFNIVGVYHTDQSRDLLTPYDKEEYDTKIDNYANSILNTSTQTIISYGFVCENYFEEEPSFYILNLSGNVKQDYAFINDLSGDNSVKVLTPYSDLLGTVEFFTDFMIVPFMVASALFAVFSALLLVNFLTVSIDSKKKDIGILRALGATKFNIMTICFCESGFVATLDFILSIVGVLVINTLLNSYFKLIVFNVSLLSIISMFLLCFGIAILATLFPINRMLKLNPVDVINKF